MEIVKKHRKEKGLTQAQAAMECGISRYYYIDVELGRRIPSVKTAKTIAKVLGFPWVLFFEDN